MAVLPLAGLAGQVGDFASELLAQYGLLALFGIFILEGAMLLYFAPSESLVPAAVLKRWFRISEEKLERFDGWFQKWGPLAVLVSNSLLFTRGMLTVPAGFAKMSTRRFAALSAVGTLIFETALALIALGVLEVV